MEPRHSFEHSNEKFDSAGTDVTPIRAPDGDSAARVAIHPETSAQTIRPDPRVALRVRHCALCFKFSEGAAVTEKGEGACLPATTDT